MFGSFGAFGITRSGLAAWSCLRGERRMLTCVYRSALHAPVGLNMFNKRRILLQLLLISCCIAVYCAGYRGVETVNIRMHARVWLVKSPVRLRLTARGQHAGVFCKSHSIRAGRLHV